MARDAYLCYVDSDAYGSGKFEDFLHGYLDERGVRDQNKCRGAAKAAAKKANQTFILEQRADMRARLVQVAIEGKLKYSAAELAVSGYLKEKSKKFAASAASGSSQQVIKAVSSETSGLLKQIRKLKAKNGDKVLVQKDMAKLKVPEDLRAFIFGVACAEGLGRR